jgi:hypothetical protein
MFLFYLSPDRQFISYLAPIYQEMMTSIYQMIIIKQQLMITSISADDVLFIS